MLPKKRRIQRKEFSQVLSVGKRYNSPSLLAYILQSGESASKFSFSVSKKVCPKAADRNTHRRRGYAVITRHIEKIHPGFLCFFSYKKGSSKISFEKLEGEVLDLLHIGGVIS